MGWTEDFTHDIRRTGLNQQLAMMTALEVLVDGWELGLGFCGVPKSFLAASLTANLCSFIRNKVCGKVHVNNV